MLFSEWKKKKQEQNQTTTTTPTTPEKTETSQYKSPASFSEWKQKKNEYKATPEGWYEDSRQLLNDVQDYYLQYRTEDDYYKGFQDRTSKLLSTANNLRSQYQGNSEAISYIDSVASALSGITDFAKKKVDYYSQWETEDAYKSDVQINKWLNRYKGKSYPDLKDALANMDQESDEYNWLTQYAPTTMKAQDYDNELSSVGGELEKLQADYDEYKKAQRLQRIDNDAKQRFNELLNQYGSEANLKGRLEELKSQKWSLENNKKYNLISKNKDFETVSKDIPEEATTVFGVQFGDNFFGWGDPIYNYINDLEGARKKAVTTSENRGAPYQKYDFMNDNEIATYNYLYNTEGKDAAKDYLEYIEYDLNERITQNKAQQSAKFATEHPVYASVMSVPTNLLGGLGALDVAWQNIEKNVSEAITGNYSGPIDYNTPSMGISVQSSTIRGTVSQNLADKYGTISLDEEDHPLLSKVFNGKSFGDVYQLGMSMADSATIAALYPILGTAGTAFLGGSAASQGILDAVSAGANDEQALMMGVINGAFEMLFEKYELDNLLGNASDGVLKAVLKQALSEGVGESATSIANTIGDIAIMADKSDFRSKIADYVAQGLSEEEATKQAFLDAAIQIGWDFVGGMATGGIMGGGASAIEGVVNTHNQNQATKDKYESFLSDLLNESLEINPDNELAKKIQTKLDKGKNISGAQIRNLVESNESTVREQDITSIQKAAISRLTELGEGGDVEALGAALTKQASGEKLSKAEQQIISNSRYGRRVSNELNVDNIRSGEYSSEWTGKIGTNKLNAEEYGRLLEEAQATEESGANVAGNSQGAQIKEIKPTANTSSPENIASNTSVKEPTEAPEIVSEDVAENTPAENTVTLSIEEVSKKYGAQAGAMVSTYNIGGGNQDVEKFDNAYQQAVNMGLSGVSFDYAMNSVATSYLTREQRELAYEVGKSTSDTEAKARETEIKQKGNGKTGWKKGVVKSEGVTLDELKATFNDTQNKAYKILSTIAEATGVDIVLYKSEVNADGEFEGAQGKYKKSEPGTVYVDVNAGLKYGKHVDDLSKYALIRTFSHEFSHFIENWNPVYYNEFRKLVFDTIDKRRGEDGDSAHDLIESKMSESSGMTYEQASREVVAEALTDILPDSNFIQELADNHKNIFQKLLEKLKEFVEQLKEYYNSIGHNRSREAAALKEQIGDSVRYVENIVEMFDKVALQAVENYQTTVATEETTAETETVTDEAPTATTEDYEHFTISENAEYGSLEIKFDGKPSEAVRNVLKDHKFRWHNKKGVWYGKADRTTIAEALKNEYQAEKIDSTVVDNVKSEPTFTEIFENASQAEKDEVVEAINQNTKISHMYPTEKYEDTKEVKPNVETENVDNTGTVQDTIPDRQGDTRVLDEVETGDVQGDVQGRDTVGSAIERGQQTGRDDNRPDTQRTVSRSGEGSGESGDIRRDDGLTSDESTEASEKLHEEVIEQIAQRSTEKPKGQNFVIGDSLDLPNGEKARYKANIDAIRLVKKLEAEGRYATEDEQIILSKYVGWGGLANAFDERKAEWSKEYTELKELLNDEEYSLARGSTLNAHYTDISVIKSMYDGLKQLGFNGGRMLEPSSGVGNFVGAMPAEMSAKVKSWTMVELDSITGLIAKYLYPNADVRIQGFETANIPNNYMDVAISNVPFGNYAIADKAYPKKVTSAIHNYFFAKSLDKVRPGGIVMFITSSYTMNSKENTVRRYIMQHADLLGAIRLPDTAFKGNAGTEVVTDILILKKRAANTNYAGEDFLEASYKYISGYNGAYINDYFESHPEMVLGTPSMDGGMYRGNNLTYKAFTDRGSLADQIKEAFSHIKGKMDYPAQSSPEKTNFAVERANKKTKDNGFEVKNGKLYQNNNGELIEVNVAKGTADRITGMLEIRDAARDLQNYQQQGLKESEITKARAKLNKLYDAFVKKNGYLNAQSNKNAIKDDPDRYSILALENWNSDDKKATKADIFTKNTVAPNRTVTSAKDVSEGLIVSVNQTGGVDAALIARLTGKTEEAVTRELIDSRQAFKNRDGALETAEIYLSGNVRAKLRDAEALVNIDADYANNVEALKTVIPEDVAYHDIFVNPGTPWIPSSVYSDFAAHMLGGRNTDWSQAVEVTRNNETGNFTVELKNKYLRLNAANTQKWGTPRRSFLDLFDAMLNSKSVVVKYKTADGQTVVDKDATAAANEKIENITKEFQEWLWKDEARRNELTTLYNETFNSIVTPKYNGDNLTVNGANALKPLRAHQRNAVQRVISSGGNTLLAHKVGAGKTYEMAAAAMKLKELGLINKPMFAVPKSLVAQWGNEFIDFFPTAKLLVAEASDFTATNRKIFANRIANGNYDAVIVSYEQFERLPISKEFERELHQEELEAVIRAIEEAKADKGAKALSVKDLEKKRKSLQTKIDKLKDVAKDEDNIEFEQLGIDSLFIDEAHNFKNLFYVTSMTNVSGLGNKDGSKRAFDLFTKVRYLQQLNGGRGIVFATATPVMNSMSEMYIMQKYLQPDLLNQLGLSSFDAWAKQFGEVVNGVEIKPSGQGYRVKQSFSRFKNINELQLLFRNIADVLTDIPGLKIPKMKGGKVNVVVCEPGQFQQDFMKELETRAENIKNVDPSVDNMLKITSDGRKISYTQRMIDPSLPYEEGCKIFRCADNVVEKYKDSKSVKGTQLIFCDMATPKGKSNTANATENEEIETDMENAKLYDDIKARLIKGGIPAKEIAFIHEADTDVKKKKLFADVNEGKVRVLIGSTGKMGVGMNAQKRVVAIHHLDAPWRPGDVEQRNGRAFRQGNINDEVECFTYVTEGSFDARLWDILERKQNFINQIMNGENVGREAEDTGEVTLSAAEVKALASGSPLIMEQVQLDTDIKKLESLRRSHLASVSNAKDRMLKDKGDITTLENSIAAGKKDVASTVDTYSEGKFSITVGKKNITEKKDAGTALMAEATAKAVETGYTSIGTFAGFDMQVVKTREGIKGQLVGAQGYPFNTYPGNTTYMINHIIATVEGIKGRVEVWERSLAETKKDLAEQEKLIATPFAKQAELDQKRARYNEVMAILNPKEEQALESVDEDVQEQSRAYLSEQAETFRNEINQWDSDGRPDGEVFIVGGTGDVFQGLGAVDNDIYMLSDKINTILTDHPEMTLKEIKNIPEILENPVMVLASKNVDRGERDNTRLTVFGMVKAQNGLPVMVTLDLHPSENKIYLDDMQKVVSAYTKDNSPTAAINLMKKSDVLYADKNKTASLLHTVDHQYVYRIEQSDFIGSIAYKNDKVNISGKKFSEVFKEKDEQNQQRTETLSDVEVLQHAAERVETDKAFENLTLAEKDALKIFQKRLYNLQSLREQRADQGKQYKELQFGTNVDREKAKQTLERMRVLDDQIKRAEAEVFEVEKAAVLVPVLKAARKEVERIEREHGKELLNRWRDRKNNAAAIKKYRDRLRGDVDELTNWVLHPNNKDIVKHIPDVLKESVIPFISSINFMSKQSLKGGDPTIADKEFMKQLNSLNSALKTNIEASGLYSGYNDLPPDFMNNLETFIKTTQKLVENNSGEFIINQMTSEELRELSKVVRTLKKYIMQLNRFHANAMFEHVYEAGENSIEYLKDLGDAGNTGVISNFLLWEQMRPAYAFERFGEGGKAIYDGLRRGQAKLAFNTKEIQSFAEKAYTEAEVKKWEDEIKTFSLGKDIVKIPVSYLMSFYELTKDPEALEHINGGGIRVATYTRKGKKISDRGHVLTVGEFNQLIGSLTDRQREVADNIQHYMAEQGGKWGNYVSVARFGEELFTNKNYFPINSDGRLLQANTDEHPSAAALYALLNMSFTKSRQEGANNRIVIYSIFDVFANHMASMAQYNALALPVLDAVKWFNYKQVFIDDEGKKHVGDNVRERMDRAYGVPEETKPGKGKSGYAQNFVMNIIKAFNGTEAQGSPNDGFWLKQLHRYNVAQVAYNFRVVVQQPLAITRAGMLIDYRSIIKGMKLKPSAIKKNIEEMQKYSGIAAWKSLGFYDVNISRGLTQLIKHDSNVLDKIGDVGMWGAEKADTLTWAAIWSACKAEVMKKQHMSPESEGFYEAVTNLFEDIIYKTQVVDSILTKNEYMRDKGFGARMVSSFMSEPTTNASMLIDAYDKYHLDIQRGMTKREAWQKNGQMIGHRIYVFAIGAVMLAAVQSVADAWRDDDDYEEWYEKWLEAFSGNLFDEFNLFNKLPIISDAYEVVEAITSPLLKYIGVDVYSTTQQTAWGQIAEFGTQATEIIANKIFEGDTNYTWYGGIYKLLQAASGMTGLPMGAATREFVTAWNNTVGAMAPSLKVKSYEPKELTEIKYAYEDGYLTAEEATEILLEKGLVDTEDEAYFIIQGWEAGEGYSKYDAIFDAVRNGGDINAAMDDLVTHGHNEADVLSEVKSKIGEWYKNGEISKQQAIAMLNKHFDLSSEEITATVNKWSSKVVTGIAFDDIKQEYLDGNINQARAIEMYVTYGGYDRAEATEIVTKWKMQKEIGIAYDDIKDEFFKGKLTAAEAKELYTTYGGYSQEEAEEKVAVMAFVKKHPKCDGISYSAIVKYQEYSEAYGVTAEVFYDAWKYNSNTKADVDDEGNAVSGSKKDKVLTYINSLDLSYEQKDSLYYAFGWAESKINEAPWH